MKTLIRDFSKVETHGNLHSFQKAYQFSDESKWYVKWVVYKGLEPHSWITFPIGSKPWPSTPDVPDWAYDPIAPYSNEKKGTEEHWMAHTSVENEQLVWEYLGYEFIEDWEDEDE
mgnify:CR=1 FL=1